jgi:2-C-methyl-D-erythritol 4-phosphate cytidylyltransferase
LGGLRALQKLHWGLRDDDRVLVHDAARPGILSAEIDAMIQALADDPVGGLLGLPVADTTKRVQNGRVVRTESRENLWLAQTPQLFVAGKLVQALERHPEVSDEALAMELEGWSPQILEGNRRNLKVTTPQDLAWLERIWKEQ